MGRPIKDLRGLVFGELSVIRLWRVKGDKAYWICNCVCGSRKAIRCDSLSSGGTKSCGCRRFGPKTPISERFWKKVCISKPDDCWEWKSGKSRLGYGFFRRSTGIMVSAHRMAYELHEGSIDEELDVLHSCDNPPCCNPKHLYQGSHQQNMTDKIIRGRMGKVVKLSAAQVLEIRRLVSSGKSQTEVARRFKVCGPTINAVVHRRTWRHV